LCFGNRASRSSATGSIRVLRCWFRSGRLQSLASRVSPHNVFWHIADYDLREFQLLENPRTPRCARSSTCRNGVRETLIPLRVSQPKAVGQVHISQNAFRKVVSSAALDEPGHPKPYDTRALWDVICQSGSFARIFKQVLKQIFGQICKHPVRKFEARPQASLWESFYEQL